MGGTPAFGRGARRLRTVALACACTLVFAACEWQYSWSIGPNGPINKVKGEWAFSWGATAADLGQDSYEDANGWIHTVNRETGAVDIHPGPNVQTQDTLHYDDNGHPYWETSPTGPVLSPRARPAASQPTDTWITEPPEGTVTHVAPDGTATVYTVPTPNGGVQPTPMYIAGGPDGNMWFTDPANDEVVSVTDTGTFTAFDAPGTDPEGITGGPDGNIWFAEKGSNKIAMLDLSNSDQITEFTVPTANSGPTEIISGPGGALWFTETAAHEVGEITTAGSFTHQFLMKPANGPTAIGVGPDDNVWTMVKDTVHVTAAMDRIRPAGGVTMVELPGVDANNAITQISPLPDGFTGPELLFSGNGKIDRAFLSTLTHFTLKDYKLRTLDARPAGIAAGPDGNVWFTEAKANRIGRINPSTGSVKEFHVPTTNSHPAGIVKGPDGALWFTETTGNKIGRITTAGQIKEFTVPTAHAFPDGIVVGPDHNLWFTEGKTNKFARLTTAGKFTEFPSGLPKNLPQPIKLGAIVSGNVSGVGPSLWFDDAANHYVAYFSPSSPHVVHFGHVSSGDPTGLAIGPGPTRLPYYAGFGGNDVVRVTPTPTSLVVQKSYPIYSAEAHPLGIVLGPDGNMWFTEFEGRARLGRFDPTTETLIELDTPTLNAQPGAITVGPDGNLWYTEFQAGQIGEVVL